MRWRIVTSAPLAITISAPDAVAIFAARSLVAESGQHAGAPPPHQPERDRQDDQQVSTDQRGNDRGKRVVVAELDFIGRNRVVVVDNRDRIRLKQFLKSILGIFP